MYLTGKANKQVEKCLHECKIALAQFPFASSLSGSPEIVISGQKSLYSKVERDGSIYYIREGSLKCIKDDKILYYAEEGDLIGFEGSSYDEGMDFFAEFAVVVVKVDPKEFLKSEELIKLWNRFQGNFLNAILQVAASSTKAETLFSPEIRNFDSGEIIIEQGTFGDEIFTLVDGLAEIIVNGESVGEVLPDQLFGAVSVLTNRERISTVKAMTECMVLVLSKEQFLALIESKPDTILRLAEDLSKAIITLNDEVTGLIRISG